MQSVHVTKWRLNPSTTVKFVELMPSLTATGRSATATAAVTALLVTLGAATLAVAPLNTDTGYSMVVARRLLNGDRLYVDMFETNPPLFYWLMSCPAILARAFHLRDDRAVGLFGGALLLVVGFSTIRMQRLEPRLPSVLFAGVMSAFVAA